MAKKSSKIFVKNAKFRFLPKSLIFFRFFHRRSVKLRRTAKRSTIEQLSSNAIDPHHFKEHLFFTHFRIFYKGDPFSVFL